MRIKILRQLEGKSDGNKTYPKFILRNTLGIGLYTYEKKTNRIECVALEKALIKIKGSYQSSRIIKPNNI